MSHRFFLPGLLLRFSLDQEFRNAQVDRRYWSFISKRTTVQTRFTWKAKTNRCPGCHSWDPHPIFQWNILQPPDFNHREREEVYLSNPTLQTRRLVVGRSPPPIPRLKESYPRVGLDNIFCMWKGMSGIDSLGEMARSILHRRVTANAKKSLANWVIRVSLEQEI